MSSGSSLPVKREARTPSRDVRKPREVKVSKKGGSYRVGGKEQPDAWRIQEEANEAKISTEVVRTEQTDTYSEVTVRAYDKDRWYTEATVRHTFKTIAREHLFGYLEKQIEGTLDEPIFQDINRPFDPVTNDPVLTPQGTLMFLKFMTRTQNFAIRDAETKAMARAQRKVLNYDWRETDEIESEKNEIKQVEDSINESKKEKRTPRSERAESKPSEDEIPKGIDPSKVEDAETTTKPRPKRTRPSRELISDEIALLKKKNPNLKKAIELLDEDGCEINKVGILKILENMLGDKALVDFDLDEFKKCKKDMGVN